MSITEIIDKLAEQRQEWVRKRLNCSNNRLKQYCEGREDGLTSAIELLKKEAK